jgi:thiol:disulfide interchange protein DsbC
MSINKLRTVLCATVLLGASVAQANEEAVKKAMNDFIGAPAVESVRKVPYGGMYEVLLQSGDLLYTDEKVGFIIDGRIIDTGRKIDVTEERRNQLAAIDFSILPLENAIKQVRGNGKRVIASFEDPNCGYCKRLGAELALMDNVTIYTFLYPLLGPDSVTKSNNIWCAKDSAKVWNEWILDNKTPPAAKCDTKAVDANVALGRKLRIQGTPTLFFADGRRVGGFLRGPQIEAVFAEVK